MLSPKSARPKPSILRPVLHHVAGKFSRMPTVSQALEEYRKAETESDWSWTYVAAALAHRRLGEYDQALRTARGIEIEFKRIGSKRRGCSGSCLREVRRARIFRASIIAFQQYPHPPMTRARLRGSG